MKEEIGRKADREKRLVALSSVIVAVALTSLKLIVGVSTGSLGILSEAAHSGLDLLAALVTFWAVRVSGQPADREHTYGHGKFENLSALFETLLLLGTCVWIIHEAVVRLFFEPATVTPSIWAFVIMGISIVLDFSRSRALKRVADRYDSQALEADALHFSTDIWSSAVVIGGLAFVFLADKLSLPWLAQADAVAALGVAGIVVWVSLRLGMKSINDLLDAVPPWMHQAVVEAAGQVAGVLDVGKVRIRRSGPETFADVTLTVSRESAFERAHDIATEAEAAIRAKLPNADVVVHVEPVGSDNESLLTTVGLLASRRSLGAHGIRIYDQDGSRKSIELHLEVDESLQLRDAHAQVSEFEAALREAVPDIAQIVSHIEPRGDSFATGRSEPGDEQPVRRALEALAAEGPLRWAPRNLSVKRVKDELAVSFECELDPSTSIADAHALTEQVEKGLRSRLPGLGRIVIHAEPAESEAAERPARSS